ncbi:hypothetical protein ABPG74_005743 [Tetrahymena malaccensis]
MEIIPQPNVAIQKIGLSQLNEMFGCLENFYFSVYQLDYYLPPFKCPTITADYLSGVCKGIFYCPKRNQILPGGAQCVKKISKDLIQADLTFYNQFKRQNHGYDVLLTIIEINTRFAYVFPLKDKKAESILECLKDLHRKENDNLKSISFDQGSEFDNKLVKEFLDQNGIRYIFFNKATNPNATSMIERFNRTIRDRISKYQSFHKQKNFIDNLKEIVNSYNNTEHSQINMTPQKAKEINYSDDKSRQEKIDTLQKIEEKFVIGDFVRVYRNKKLFEKGQKSYTKNIYQIVGREGNNYILKKFKDGKLLEKQIEKTAAYLQKVNIFDLFSKQKVKREISKQEVKKVTDLFKRLRREGVDVENIIPDNQPPPPLPPQNQNIRNILKMNQAELRAIKEKNEKKIQQANIENSNLRRKSVDIAHQLNKQLEEKDEEILLKNKELVQTNKKQKYLTFLQNMRAFLAKFDNNLEQILKDKTKRVAYLKFHNYNVGGTYHKIKQKPEDFRKTSGKKVKETLENMQKVIVNEIDSINKKITEIEKQQNFNKKDVLPFIKNLIDFSSQLGDNYSLNQQDHQQNQDQYADILQKLDKNKPKNQPQQHLSDSEHFRQNELDNYDNEIQINQKIEELQQAIEINQEYDEIENQQRIQEYQIMIEMLQEKLNEIKNYIPIKPKKREIGMFDFVQENDDSFQNYFDKFNNYN